MSGSAYSQQFLHLPTATSVPHDLRHGVFANALLVQQLNGQLILDFLTTLIAPHELVARVVVNSAGLTRIVATLQRNFDRFVDRFGPVSRSPLEALPESEFSEDELPSDASVANSNQQPDIAQVYHGLVLPDERIVGLSADSLAVRFTSSEFCLDFVGNFYPRSVLACRILVAAVRIPAILATLSDSLRRRAE